MAERFLIRTEGGPCDGETRVATADELPWPLPQVLEWDETGQYVKYDESALGPQAEDSGLLRGATYRWERASAEGGTDG